MLALSNEKSSSTCSQAQQLNPTYGFKMPCHHRTAAHLDACNAPVVDEFGEDSRVTFCTNRVAVASCKLPCIPLTCPWLFEGLNSPIVVQASPPSAMT